MFTRFTCFDNVAWNKTRKTLQVIVLKRLPILVAGLSNPDESKPHRQRLVGGLPHTFRQINFPGIAPETLEIVKIASLGVKEVNDEITVIEQHPFCCTVSFDPHRPSPKLLLELIVNPIGDRL